MNWNKIKEKYPKAWGLFGDDWAIKRHIYYDDERNYMEDDVGSPVSNRLLYDFFDEQRIYIEMHRNIWRNSFWYYIIGTLKLIKPNYPTRTEAEEKAFEKAFEILEGKV